VIAAFASGMAATVVLAAFAWLLVRARILPSRMRERVIVTLKSGESFAGVLFSHDNKALVLRETEALGVGEKRTNLVLDGELIVLLRDVAYIQKP
jgi:small nuclear ribonucleoprotein (snRNP)-like protein